MKTAFFIVFAMVDIAFGHASSAQTKLSDPATVRVVDPVDIASVKKIVEGAVSTNNSELLIVAMHNPDYEAKFFVLDKVDHLPIKTQASLLSSILLDSKRFFYDGEARLSDAEQDLFQMDLQIRVQNMIHQLLHDGKQAHKKFLSRTEAIDLAAKLNKL